MIRFVSKQMKPASPQSLVITQEAQWEFDEYIKEAHILSGIFTLSVDYNIELEWMDGWMIEWVIIKTEPIQQVIYKKALFPLNRREYSQSL